MSWETVIGLETHVELSTQTKIFCGCAAAFGGAPNTRCCPVCLGLPGALPVLNERVVEYAVRAALALGCTVCRDSRFDRKHYVYPDLPKAYQITQRHLPLGRGGGLRLSTGRTIRIAELHMEEDAGKLLHQPAEGVTRVDFNRCGVPLLEIVTAPDFHSGDEAVDYLERLRSVLRYLGVSDGKIQEGSLRCDVNLSVRRAGETALGTRTELKNLGSFRAVRQAVEQESARQIAILEAGGTVAQETRRWDEARGCSHPMRAKETDYRYCPEPDLPPLNLDEALVAEIGRGLPRLAAERVEAYQADWGLSAYDAELLTGERALADFFEAVVALGEDPKQTANWMTGQVLRRLARDGTDPETLPLSPRDLAAILRMVRLGRLNRSTAVKVFDAVWDGAQPEEYVARHSLGQISDGAAVESAVRRVLAEHPGPVADWRAGTEKAFGFLVGQAMRALEGRADPALVRAALEKQWKRSETP